LRSKQNGGAKMDCATSMDHSDNAFGQGFSSMTSGDLKSSVEFLFVTRHFRIPSHSVRRSGVPHDCGRRENRVAIQKL
jgi:hypothetical protein